LKAMKFMLLYDKGLSSVIREYLADHKTSFSDVGEFIEAYSLLDSHESIFFVIVVLLQAFSLIVLHRVSN